MKVEFYCTEFGRSPIQHFIEDQPKADQARFVDVIAGIERYGLSCPRVEFRQLRGKLWEIKFRSTGGGYRVAYVLLRGDRMIWLHAFKKQSQKTSPTDLALAYRRMKDVLNE
jgi:phage-related protein